MDRGTTNVFKEIEMTPKDFGMFLLDDPRGAETNNIITQDGLRDNASRCRELMSKWLNHGVRTWAALIEVFKGHRDLTALGKDIEAGIKAGKYSQRK